MSKRKLGSRNKALIQPALCLWSPCAGEGGNLVFTWGDVADLWGRVGEARLGGLSLRWTCSGEGFPDPMSTLHGASQQRAARDALGTHRSPMGAVPEHPCLVQGQADPCPPLVPHLGAPANNFQLCQALKRHFWGCRRVLRWEERHHADLLLPSLVSRHCLPFFSLITWFIWGQHSSYPVFPYTIVPHLPMSAHAYSSVLVHCSDAGARGPSGALVASCSCERGSLSQWCPLPVGAEA